MVFEVTNTWPATSLELLLARYFNCRNLTTLDRPQPTGAAASTLGATAARHGCLYATPVPTRCLPAPPAPPHAAPHSSHVIARDGRTASSLGASPYTSMQPAAAHPPSPPVHRPTRPAAAHPKHQCFVPYAHILTTSASPHTPSRSSPEPSVHPVAPYAQPQLTP